MQTLMLLLLVLALLGYLVLMSLARTLLSKLPLSNNLLALVAVLGLVASSSLPWYLKPNSSLFRHVLTHAMLITILLVVYASNTLILNIRAI